MTQALAERMALHTAGQITWPDLETRKPCAVCDRFTNAGIAPSRQVKGYGRCGLVKMHQKVDGAQFIGTDARACPQFRER